MTKKIIGILGGMGPQASCELYRLINTLSIREYGAQKNDEFPYLRISSLPVPDLISNQENKEKTIAMAHKEAKALLLSGVTDIVMPCNTMHLYADSIIDCLDLQFHALPEIVLSEAQNKKYSQVLILGTNTTIKSELYQSIFKKHNISYVEPDETLVELSVQVIVNTISGIENPQLKQLFLDEVLSVVNLHKVDSILLACTELPIAIQNPIGNLPLLSSLELAAKHVCNIHFNDI